MANGKKHHQIGLDDRTRDDDGAIRQKRGDTLVRTLRQIYGPDFAPDVRSDMRLDTLRERFGGDKRPILRMSLVSEDPDLARGSDVFYYFSAGFLTVWLCQPSSQ